jgi:hypothetical protein
VCVPEWPSTRLKRAFTTKGLLIPPLFRRNRASNDPAPDRIIHPPTHPPTHTLTQNQKKNRSWSSNGSCRPGRPRRRGRRPRGRWQGSARRLEFIADWRGCCNMGGNQRQRKANERMKERTGEDRRWKGEAARQGGARAFTIVESCLLFPFAVLWGVCIQWPGAWLCFPPPPLFSDLCEERGAPIRGSLT